MRAKKNLGQHFLRSSHYVKKIVDAGEVTEGNTVVEIGPGEGMLTQELLARGARIIAIEKDSRLIPVLRERFSKEIKEKRLFVFEEDALTFEIPKQLLPKSYKVIANIPYYITGGLIRKFLTNKHQPTCIVFLTQKEVAERIARSKKESILSLSVKVYGTPSFVQKVPRGAFTPAPEVDSAILKIDHISRENFPSATSERRFFELLHAGFGKKRKLLKNNLASVIADANIDILENARAEDVPLDTWLSLATY